MCGLEAKALSGKGRGKGEKTEKKANPLRSNGDRTLGEERVGGGRREMGKVK